MREIDIRGIIASCDLAALLRRLVTEATAQGRSEFALGTRSPSKESPARQINSTKSGPLVPNTPDMSGSGAAPGAGNAASRFPAKNSDACTRPRTNSVVRELGKFSPNSTTHEKSAA